MVSGVQYGIGGCGIKTKTTDNFGVFKLNATLVVVVNASCGPPHVYGTPSRHRSTVTRVGLGHGT